MTTITALTHIAAPGERCFRLALDLDIEIEAMRPYGLRAISGTTHGEIKAGESVTWEVKQFGLRFRHTTEISLFDPPHSFQDRMVRGLLAHFSHDHHFSPLESASTAMQDVLSFAMPWYLGGPFAERFFVKRRMEHLLHLRNDLIRKRAEHALS